MNAARNLNFVQKLACPRNSIFSHKKKYNPSSVVSKLLMENEQRENEISNIYPDLFKHWVKI